MEGNEKNISKARNSLTRSPPQLKVNSQRLPIGDSKRKKDNTMLSKPTAKEISSQTAAVMEPLTDDHTHLQTQRPAKQGVNKCQVNQDSDYELTTMAQNQQLMSEAQKLISALEKKINKENAKLLIDYYKQLEHNCNSLILENSKLRGQVEVLQSTKECETQLVTEKLDMLERKLESINQNPSSAQDPLIKSTYADKVRSEPNNLVLFKHDGEIKKRFPTINELKTEVKKSIDPAKQGLRIRNVVTTNRGLLIQTHRKEDAQKITRLPQLVDLKPEIPKARNPRIIVYDVPTDLDKEQLTSLFWSQNAFGLKEEESTFSPVFRTGKAGGPTAHWVVEVSPDLRKELLRESRIYLNYFSHRFKDWTRLTRCHKCQSFGHIQAHCRAEYKYCSHCAERGHEEQNCPRISEPPKCINCIRIKQESTHSAAEHSKCVAYQKAVERLMTRTNYG